MIAVRRQACRPRIWARGTLRPSLSPPAPEAIRGAHPVSETETQTGWVWGTHQSGRRRSESLVQSGKISNLVSPYCKIKNKIIKRTEDRI